MSRPIRARRPGAVPDAGPVPPWASVAVGAVFIALYLGWAPAVSGDKDSSEFTVVLATLGLAHPTGYPLYTVLGHMFVIALHALGAGWAWAANAWSAVGGAAALGLWHAFGARLLRREGVGGKRAALVALLPAVAFGMNPAWTAEATLAEVNSWHLAWVAAACLFALATLAELPARRADHAWTARRAATWGLLVGLGLAHHATSVLVALPLTVALFAATSSRKAAWLAFAAAALLVPLVAWSYVLYRSVHPAVVQWGSLGPGLHETWNHVSAAGYRHYLGGFRPSPEQRAILATQVYPWLAPGLLAAALWPFAGARVPRHLRLALTAAVFLQIAYVFGYGVGDPATYFLAPLALGAFLLPAVVAAFGPLRRLAWPLSGLAGLGLAFAAWSWNGAALERRANCTGVDGFLRTMWQAVPIQGGYVLWDDDMSYRLVEYQRLEHVKPALVVVRPLLLMDAGARELFARRHGFDPLGGAPPPRDDEADSPARIEEFARQIGDGINRGTPDSVILFLPREPSLRLLTKPVPAGLSAPR
jgi:hypothetical protein